MAALTDVKNTLFGALGVEDPEVFKAGVAIKRGVNFAITNLAASTNYAFLPIPAGFVMTGVYVKETAKCTSGTVTLKTKEDATKVVGSSVTVGGSTLAEQFLYPVAPSTADAAGDPIAFLAADTLCVVTSAAMSAGAIEVVVHGYLMNGGSLTPKALEVPYREGQSEADYDANKSSGDLHLKKIAAGA